MMLGIMVVMTVLLFNIVGLFVHVLLLRRRIGKLERQLNWVEGRVLSTPAEWQYQIALAEAQNLRVLRIHTPEPLGETATEHMTPEEQRRLRELTQLEQDTLPGVAEAREQTRAKWAQRCRRESDRRKQT